MASSRCAPPFTESSGEGFSLAWYVELFFTANSRDRTGLLFALYSMENPVSDRHFPIPPWWGSVFLTPEERTGLSSREEWTLFPAGESIYRLQDTHGRAAPGCIVSSLRKQKETFVSELLRETQGWILTEYLPDEWPSTWSIEVRKQLATRFLWIPPLLPHGAFPPASGSATSVTVVFPVETSSSISIDAFPVHGPDYAEGVWPQHLQEILNGMKDVTVRTLDPGADALAGLLPRLGTTVVSAHDDPAIASFLAMVCAATGRQYVNWWPTGSPWRCAYLRWRYRIPLAQRTKPATYREFWARFPTPSPEPAFSREDADGVMDQSLLVGREWSQDLTRIFAGEAPNIPELSYTRLCSGYPGMDRQLYFAVWARPESPGTGPDLTQWSRCMHPEVINRWVWQELKKRPTGEAIVTHTRIMASKIPGWLALTGQARQWAYARQRAKHPGYSQLSEELASHICGYGGIGWRERGLRIALRLVESEPRREEEWAILHRLRLLAALGRLEEVETIIKGRPIPPERGAEIVARWWIYTMQSHPLSSWQPESPHPVLRRLLGYTEPLPDPPNPLWKRMSLVLDWWETGSLEAHSSPDAAVVVWLTEALQWIWTGELSEASNHHPEPEEIMDPAGCLRIALFLALRGNPQRSSDYLLRLSSLAPRFFQTWTFISERWFLMACLQKITGNEDAAAAYLKVSADFWPATEAWRIRFETLPVLARVSLPGRDWIPEDASPAPRESWLDGLPDPVD